MTMAPHCFGCLGHKYTLVFKALGAYGLQGPPKSRFHTRLAERSLLSQSLLLDPLYENSVLRIWGSGEPCEERTPKFKKLEICRGPLFNQEIL